MPVADVFCLPLWLNEVEPGRMPEMIELQLESRGFASGTQRTIYQWQVAASEKDRTLVLVGILPASLRPDLQIKTYEAFDVSARYLAFSENSLTLWREQGKLSAAFTRGKSLVYFQNLGEEDCSDRAIQSLTCLRTSLEIQNILPSLQAIDVATSLNSAQLAALGRAFGISVRENDASSFTPPKIAWNLCPPEVSEARKKHQSRRWKSRSLLAALTVYLLIAGALVLHWFLMASKITALRQWQATHAAALAFVGQAQEDWKNIAPVVDPHRNSLEILLGCAQAIPKDQLHLTSFEMENGVVRIKGEANNVSAAYVFFDHLKTSPSLAAFTWKMDEPHLLPNDLAQLQIEGTLAQANP